MQRLGLPGSKLDASVLDLAHLYAAFAKGGDKGEYLDTDYTAGRIRELFSAEIIGEKWYIRGNADCCGNFGHEIKGEISPRIRQ